MKYLYSVLSIVIIFSCNQPIEEKQQIPQEFRNVRYAHQKINVRNGPGKNYKIVGSLLKNDEVEVDSLNNGWIIVYKNSVREGYVYATLLKKSPIREIQTSEGKFIVPGFAYVDGRDPNAYPPITLMDPNIWDSINRNRPICTIRHGKKVKLLNAELFYLYLSFNHRYS